MEAVDYVLMGLAVIIIILVIVLVTVYIWGLKCESRRHKFMHDQFLTKRYTNKKK